MIGLLEIGVDNFEKADIVRCKLQQERRSRCSQYLNSYHLILYSPNNKKRLDITNESLKVTVYKIGGNKYVAPIRMFKAGCSVLRKQKVEIISTIDPFTSSLVGLALKIFFRLPLVVQLHFDYSSRYFWSYFPKISRIINLFLSKIVFIGSDGIRVVSTYQKNLLLGQGIKAKIIDVIPTPVDTELIVEANINKSICEQYRQIPQTMLLLYVGRLGREKDLTMLLNAFKIILKAYNNVRLLIVGSGSIESELRNLAHDLDIHRHVFFLGSISHELVFSYYYGSDIFVITSQCEGRGTVIAEAALCKKPIVVTRCAGTQDLIKDGETGFVVDIQDYKKFAEKVLILLNNPAMAKEFGKRGYEYVSKKIEEVNSIKALVGLWERTVNNAKPN